MKEKILLTILSVLLTGICWGQNINHKVFLIGNTVDIKDKDAFVTHFSEILQKEKSPYTIVFNGDLIDKKPAGDNLKEMKHLLKEISKVSKGKIIVVPGDRDWDNSGKNGWDYVKDLGHEIRGMKLKNVEWPNDDACPGPKDIFLNDNLLLITIDTQWWNHPYRKVMPADADCKVSTTSSFKEEFTELIEENGDKNILIVGHFPLMSSGHYGGRYTLKDWIFPVPVFKGVITSYHQNIGRAKDLSNKNFQPFAHMMNNVIGEYNSVIYASAHEKDIEIRKQGNNYYINSGLPEGAGFAATNNNTAFATEQAGIMSVNYFDNGKTTATYLPYGSKKNEEFPLFVSKCYSDTLKHAVNDRFMPCMPDTAISVHEPTSKYTTKVAGKEYKRGPFYKWLLGDHYRSSWTTTVEVPYLDMDTTFGGLTPYAVGGGRQTSSLKIKGGNGMEYVFRSVNKDPIKALPYELRGTVVSSVLRDQTTTQQPYGAMAVSVMLDELNVLHARPVLYVMPESKRLGAFNNGYSEMLGMLEEKPINPKKVDSVFAGADEVEHTIRMFRELYEDNDNEIAQDEFLEARVFDILIGDWGKHEDNWKWVGFEKEKGILYRPVPRDRDHAFSRWDGALPWIADREWAKASGENFDYKIKGLRSLMWQARHMDRPLTNEATLADWLQAADRVQTNITDEVIEKAVRSMPSEIYEPDGKEIEDKLKARKKDLKLYAEEYYHMMAKDVDVVGTEKDEIFDVVRLENGDVHVRVYKNKDDQRGKLLYDRVLHPKETNEIRLFGLDDKDIFNISGNVKRSILIRVIPGPEKDSINDQSTVKGLRKQTIVYEKGKTEAFALGEEGKLSTNKNLDAYLYDRQSFAYDTYFPLAYISYNADNGLALNAGVKFTQQQYGKPDFGSIHAFNVTATTIGNFEFDYKGKWRYVFGKWDTYINTFIGLPQRLNYYFGRGNDSYKNEEWRKGDYYDIQHNTYRLEGGVERNLLKRSHLQAGVAYEYNSEDLESNPVLAASESIGVSSPGKIGQSLFIARANADFDFRDKANLPMRGMRFWANYNNGVYLKNTNFDNYGIIDGGIEQYMSNYWRNPITFGVRVGGSTSFGDVPYYHLKYLGQNNNLLGYRRNRFTGTSTSFINTELRLQLLERKTRVLPIKLGVRGFADAGRVYDHQDISDNWHSGFGAGFYLVPLDEKFSLNVSVGFSEEESGLLLFSIGNVFN